jgi:hypothetical protein
LSEEPFLRDPPRVVAVAYLLALLCLLAPPAVIGALFAGVVLARRNRALEGIGVIVLALACTAAGLTLLR